MRVKYRKLLISLLCLFMVCLIASTSTTTVTAAGNWGTLKAGDEMKWSSVIGKVEIKVQSVAGDTITLEYSSQSGTRTRTIVADESSQSANMQLISPFLKPKSQLSGSTQNYEFEGTSYKAYYFSFEYADGSKDENWRDFNTGILFEIRFTDAEGSSTSNYKLTSTNADLAEAGAGGCLGTILIALVSVSAVVSYSLVRYRKKETT